jgi:hypothetical protein
MRRASISVPANIAEGFKKRGNSLSPPDFSENTAFRRSQPRARFRIFHSVTPATPATSLKIHPPRDVLESAQLLDEGWYVVEAGEEIPKVSEHGVDGARLDVR